MNATLDERAVESARGYDCWFARGWGRYAWQIERQAPLRGVNAMAGVSVAVDVGCGTGRSTQAVQTTAARVIGVDRSQAMLAVARHRKVAPFDRRRHLLNAVTTGSWCSYQPDTDIAWTVQPGRAGPDDGVDHSGFTDVDKGGSTAPSKGRSAR